MAEGFKGMQDMLIDLKALSPRLEAEGARLIDKYANAAAQSMRTQYPAVTGNLRRGVRIKREEPLIVRVQSIARHAHLYEYGTLPRETNFNANRGVMPGNPVLVPTAIRWRRELGYQYVSLIGRTQIRGMTGTLEVVRRGN